jgi:TATA-binding protein-associated factor Taf7
MTQRQQQQQQQQQYQYVYSEEDDDDEEEEEEEEEQVPPPPPKKARRQSQQAHQQARELQSMRIQHRLMELRMQLEQLRRKRLNRDVTFGLAQTNRMRDLQHRWLPQTERELQAARRKQQLES